MGTYEDKLARVIALGVNVWVAEYRFAKNLDANGAALAVAHHVPRLVELAKAGKADMVVADFDDQSWLFFGGELDDDIVASAHRAVIAFGGIFDVARRPPDSALTLTAQGVKDPRESGMVTAETLDRSARSGGYAYETAKPWWKFWA